MKKIILLTLTVYLFGCHNRNNRPAIPTGQEGKAIPSFDMLLIDSATRFNTANIPIGKPVVVLYLSPVCPFCRAELTSILKNMASMETTRFYIITNWPFAQFKAFYKQFELAKYDNVVAGQDYNNAFATHYPVRAVPFTAFYDRRKNLNKAFIGLMPIEQIKGLEARD